MLALARVVEIRPESHAVDIVLLDDGRRIGGVQVMSGSAGSDFGLTDLSLPDSTGFKAETTKTRDIFAVVSFVRDQPIVLGFLFPQVAQCLFKDKERMIYRHASDVYTTIDKGGNTEVYHPSGTYLRIGESPSHEDLTGKDYDKKWKIKRNTGKAVHVHLTVANGGSVKATVDIDPSGNIVVTNVGNTQISTTGTMKINSGGTMDFVAGGNLSFTAPRIDWN